jgi:hypothetical protein
MRGLLIVGMLLLLGWPSGRSTHPINSVAVALANPGDATTMSDTSLAQLLAQAGAVGILAVVLFFYRRDFMRRNDAEVQRTTDIADVLKASTEAITDGAVATARQTDATHRLARAVENIERREAGLPPRGKSTGV